MAEGPAAGRAGYGRVAWRALRHRPGQAVAIAALSVLAVAACAFGPLYLRSVAQAQLGHLLDGAPISARGVSLSAQGSAQDPTPARPTGSRFFGRPVSSVQVPVGYRSGEIRATGLLASREDVCHHVTVTVGRCVTKPTEVMASAPAARVLGLHIGSTLHAVPDLSGSPAFIDVTVVGLYQPFDAASDYWFDRPYSSPAGAVEGTNINDPSVQADALFAGDGFDQLIVRSVGTDGFLEPIGVQLDVPLRPAAVRVDDLPALRRDLRDVAARADQVGVRLDTALPSVLDQADAGTRQAGLIVPGLAWGLAFLVLVVIGIVILIAADQRRPEFALARLRGRSRTQAGRLLVRETGPLVILSLLPGLAVAWLVDALVARRWLRPGSGPEFRWPVFAAAAAVLAVELLVIVVVARGAARAPVADLLRGVPRQLSRRGVGALEAAVGAAAIGGTVVALSAGDNNPLTVLTPGLIALIAGLLCGRLLVAVARRVGRDSLWSGRLGVGLAALQIARRPGVRPVVTLLCVAVALVVAGAQQDSVAARNRATRAAVAAGAPVVLTVNASTPNQVESVLAAADPAGRYATPVVVQEPPNGTTVLAVQPAAFDRIAGWGWSRDRPPPAVFDRLTPARPAPVRLVGTTVQFDLGRVTVRRDHPTDSPAARSAPVYLFLALDGPNGRQLGARLGPLPETTPASTTLIAPVDCAAGCSVRQMSLLRGGSDADVVTVDVPILAVRAGTAGSWHPVELGRAADWGRATPDVAGSGHTQTVGLRNSGSALVFSAVNAGSATAMQQLSQPIALPAVVAGAVSQTPNALGYLDGNNIDGLTTSFEQVADAPLAPGVGGPALIVDLGLAVATSTQPTTSSQIQVWLASADATREKQLVAALATKGIGVVGRDTTAAHLAELDASGPAWAMRLTWVAAGLAIALATLVLVISAAAARPGRSYDASALRLVGVHGGVVRRALAIEQVAMAVVAVVVGTVAGLIGAHLVLPSMPIFLTPAATPAVVRTPTAAPVSVAALVCLAVLATTGVVVALITARRVGPARLQEGAP